MSLDHGSQKVQKDSIYRSELQLKSLGKRI